MTRSRRAALLGLVLGVLVSVCLYPRPASSCVGPSYGCQYEIGKASAALIAAKLKAWQRCYNAVLGGKTCKVAARDEALAEAEAAFHAAIEEHCTEPGLSPADLGFVGNCPEPCSTIEIDGYPAVGTCLACLQEHSVDAILDDEYGARPPALPTNGPLGDEPLACQRAIAKAGVGFANGTAKALRKCENFVALSDPSEVCPTESIESKRTALAATVGDRMDRCVDFSGVEACGDDLVSATDCVVAGHEQQIDDVFRAAYPSFPLGAPNAVIFSPEEGEDLEDGGLVFVGEEHGRSDIADVIVELNSQVVGTLADANPYFGGTLFAIPVNASGIAPGDAVLSVTLAATKGSKKNEKGKKTEKNVKIVPKKTPAPAPAPPAATPLPPGGCQCGVSMSVNEDQNASTAATQGPPRHEGQGLANVQLGPVSFERTEKDDKQKEEKRVAAFWRSQIEAAIEGDFTKCVRKQHSNWTNVYEYGKVTDTEHKMTAKVEVPFKNVGENGFKVTEDTREEAPTIVDTIKWAFEQGAINRPKVFKGNTITKVSSRGHYEAIVNSNVQGGKSCKCVWNIEFTKTVGKDEFAVAASFVTGALPPGVPANPGIPAGAKCRSKSTPWATTGTGTFE